MFVFLQQIILNFRTQCHGYSSSITKTHRQVQEKGGLSCRGNRGNLQNRHIALYRGSTVFPAGMSLILLKPEKFSFLCCFFYLQWVDNILSHKAEADRIIFEDVDKEIGFIMLPDLKWDGQIETLNLLVLPFQRIRSIRELADSHLPLLQNIRKKVLEIVPKRYKVSSSHLRLYFHYQPSYYHLHVHVSHLNYESGINVDKIIFKHRF